MYNEALLMLRNSLDKELLHLITLYLERVKQRENNSSNTDSFSLIVQRLFLNLFNKLTVHGHLREL